MKSKYDKQNKESIKLFEFDLYNDFDNTYSLIEKIEKAIKYTN